MFRKIALTGILFLAALFLFAACATVPITGRKQLSLIPDSEMNALSFQQYDQVIAESDLSADPEAAGMVLKVGMRIQKAVETYFRENGLSSHLEGYQWEFNLFSCFSLYADIDTFRH